MAEETETDAERFKPSGNEITIRFSNPKAAENFLQWLCDLGEQDYWDWMQSAEKFEPEGDITAVDFNYHEPGHGVVTATCGRLDRDRHLWAVGQRG